MRYLLFLTVIINSLFANPLEFKTFSSDFTQKITNENNSTIDYKGTFYATSDSKALWIYKFPVKKSIYFKKERVLIIEPELEQVIITTLKKSPNLAEIIKEAKKIKENEFEATFNDTIYHITVKNDQIVNIKYTDKLGNRVKISLSNQKKDAPLRETLFKPVIPKDYDIISE